MPWKKFLYVYETDIVSPGVSFPLDNVKIESFNDGRELNVATHMQRVVLLGRQTTLSQSATLKTDASHTTLLLTARTKDSNIYDARRACIEFLDSAVALIGNIYDPAIFDKCLYKGWDYSDPRSIIVEALPYLTETVHRLDSKFITNTYEALEDKTDQFIKMSKLYSQAASMPISEEKFVKLWTILEIFPLETKSGQQMEVARLENLLKSVSGVSKTQIIKKLKIYPEIYGKYRSQIVHTGSTEFSEIELKDITAKLDIVVRIVMRNMLGLDYDNELSNFI